MSAENECDGRRDEELHAAHAQMPTSSDARDLTVSTLIYVFGGIAYAVLCGPAIGQRGFPPIDPFWTAATFLWVTPILLSAIVDARPMNDRLTGFAIYCFATALFDAASMVMVVPKTVDAFETIIMALFIFWPLHLIVGSVAYGTIRTVCAFSLRLGKRFTPAAAKIVRWTALAGVAVLTISFPFFFRQFVFFEAAQRARAQAELDWKTGEAKIFREDYPDTDIVWHEFDPTTGLEYRTKWPLGAFGRAYNEQVDGLLRGRGIPDWSMKPYLVPDDELLALLDSDNFEEVKTFPHDVNDNIVLSKSNSGDSLSIAAKRSGTLGMGIGGPTYVGRAAQYPGVVFVRIGRLWIAAYLESGVLLSSGHPVVAAHP